MPIHTPRQCSPQAGPVRLATLGKSDRFEQGPVTRPAWKEGQLWADIFSSFERSQLQKYHYAYRAAWRDAHNS